ncbi:MAG: anthranilate phosphoribosyltransferase [Pseudomonadota bacterium]|nr:anthranilate phosphoribosyltransferase [Pseudomonadota bacterium]
MSAPFVPARTLNRLIHREDLNREEMLAMMRAVMQGELTPVQTAGLIVALRSKGETVTEVAAAAEVMRELSLKVETGDQRNLVDTCGTGGDGLGTFNISTTAAFVAAAAGARVAKHGGRSVSSLTGSADVLEALGADLSRATPQTVADSLDRLGVGFMFAPQHHAAMKHAAPIRRELGVRTVFNLLGPLTNPAGAPCQVLGVYDEALTGLMARVLQRLGSRHVLVVHGLDGLDEISISGPTRIAELRHGEVAEYMVTPQELGFSPAPLTRLRIENAEQSARLVRTVLGGEAGPARDIVLLNAGAAIYAADLTDSLLAGIARARDAIDSGEAGRRLDAFIAMFAHH